MAANTIKLSGELETRVEDALVPLHPEKVILFGSYAWGQPTEDSDIDLYVVTQFVETDSSFARQIMEEGSACYEERTRRAAGIRRDESGVSCADRNEDSHILCGSI